MSAPRRAAALVIALVAVAVAAVGCSPSAPQVEAAGRNATVDKRYVIPAGTAKRIAAGESVRVLPERLTLKVGQVISIRNDDDAGQIVGPFFVAAHSSMTERFTTPGHFVGKCSVHLSGQIVLDVTS